MSGRVCGCAVYRDSRHLRPVNRRHQNRHLQTKPHTCKLREKQESIPVDTLPLNPWKDMGPGTLESTSVLTANDHCVLQCNVHE